MLLTLGAACGGDALQEAHEEALEAARDREGHERMVTLLRGVAERVPLENSYLGDRALRNALGILERLDADVHAGVRATSSS